MDGLWGGPGRRTLGCQPLPGPDDRYRSVLKRQWHLADRYGPALDIAIQRYTRRKIQLPKQRRPGTAAGIIL